MEWYVYNEDFNRRVIERVNILGNAENEIRKIRKKSDSYEKFSENLRREMMWRYWSRCEYEIVVAVTNENRIVLKPWVNPKNGDITFDVTDDENFDWRDFVRCHRITPANDKKIDVYAQLRFRWDDFCKYCWDFTGKRRRKNK